MKNILKIVFLIIGTLIGAGFASGREIYIFFSKYGKLGILGIILSSLITSTIIKKVLIIVKNNNIKNYYEFLEVINLKHKKINIFINIIVNAFLLISYFIMIAGFGAYMKQSYGINIYLSSILFTLLCGIIFLKNINGVIKINEILVPILIIFIIYLGLRNLPFIASIKYIEGIDTRTSMWWIQAILYASYNSIILIPILTNIKLKNINEKQIKKISILSGIVIILLSLLIYGLLLRGTGYIQTLELPLIEVALEFGIIFKYIYGFIIVISIFTSAISAGYSVLQNISKNRKNYYKNLIIISVIAIFISNIGFSNLVQILYPTFGILGLLQIILILK